MSIKDDIDEIAAIAYMTGLSKAESVCLKYAEFQYKTGDHVKGIAGQNLAEDIHALIDLKKEQMKSRPPPSGSLAGPQRRTGPLPGVGSEAGPE